MYIFEVLLFSAVIKLRKTPKKIEIKKDKAIKNILLTRASLTKSSTARPLLLVPKLPEKTLFIYSIIF